MQLSGFMMTKFNLPRVKRLSAQNNISHHLQKVIFGMSRKETIPQQQPFKVKQDSPKDSCRIFYEYSFEQNGLTGISSGMMLRNILPILCKFKDPGIASSMWDFLKDSILVSVSYTNELPVLVNLICPFTEYGNFVL